jgi:DNA-binding GntR family transcriptional regulator
MKSEALVRPLLRDRAYNELRALIVAGTLAPGSFLSERKLSDRLGMSKTPIKAALALLESEGFVLVSPQQGIVVREITAREVVDLFDVRIAVESYICRRLAGNLATEQEKQLRTNIARQRIAVEKVNHSAFNGLDAALHLLIAGMSENREIIAAI